MLALIAALFGFTGIAGSSLFIARILFFVFIVIFLAGLLYTLFAGARPRGV